MPSWARLALWRVIKVIWLGGRKKFSFRWYGTNTWWVIRLSIGIGMYHQVLIFCHDRLTNTKREIPFFKINFGLLSFIVFIIKENFLAYQGCVWIDFKLISEMIFRKMGVFGCYFKFGQTEKHFQLTEFESQNNGNDFPFLFSLQSTFGLGK